MTLSVGQRHKHFNDFVLEITKVFGETSVEYKILYHISNVYKSLGLCLIKEPRMFMSAYCYLPGQDKKNTL
jgi:hypothetical protein